NQEEAAERAYLTIGPGYPGHTSGVYRYSGAEQLWKSPEVRYSNSGNNNSNGKLKPPKKSPHLRKKRSYSTGLRSWKFCEKDLDIHEARSDDYDPESED